MREHPRYSPGPHLRLGRVFGIEVQVHWLLLLLLLVELVLGFFRPGSLDVGQRWVHWGALALGLLLSVLVHELGHCYAAIRLGGTADRVLLWPLGGLVPCNVGMDPRAQIAASMAGPLSNLSLLGLAALGCWAGGWPLLPELSESAGFQPGALVLQYLVVWNLVLFVVNALPCTPLDGGQAFHSWVWLRGGDLEKASSWTARAGHAVAAIALVFALLVFFSALFEKSFALRHPLLHALQFGLLLLAVAHFVEARLAGVHARRDEPDDTLFGYDFSNGYTSLERTGEAEGPRTTLRRGLRRSESAEVASERRRLAEVETKRRVDALLKKIHEQGFSSLSRAERRFLRKASRLYQ